MPSSGCRQRIVYRLLADYRKIDTIEKRAVIKYLCLNGLSAQKIHEHMRTVLGDNAPSTGTAYRWYAELKRSTEDEHRSGRPVEACTHGNIDFAQDLILNDHRLTMRYVAECLSLSTGTIHHSILDVLGYKKVCARWIPRMLTGEMMRQRVQTSEANLELYRTYPEVS